MLHILTTCYKTLKQNCTTLENTAQVYKILQRFTKYCKTLQQNLPSLKLYKIMQTFTKYYKIIQ